MINTCFVVYLLQSYLSVIIKYFYFSMFEEKEEAGRRRRWWDLFWHCYPNNHLYADTYNGFMVCLLFLFTYLYNETTVSNMKNHYFLLIDSMLNLLLVLALFQWPHFILLKFKKMYLGTHSSVGELSLLLLTRCFSFTLVHSRVEG